MYCLVFLSNTTCTLLQLDSLAIHCFYCGFIDDNYEDILEHLKQNHHEHQRKYKYYSLCPKIGHLSMCIKAYDMIPDQLGEDRELHFDRDKSKVMVANSNPNPNNTPNSPP